MAVAKVWHLIPHDQAAIDRLAGALGVSPVAAQLLLNRGFTAPDAARRFLESPLTGLHEPSTLPGVSLAVEQLQEAIAARLPVCIYGDYDADGITGAAVLLRLFQILDLPVTFHVPNRLEDGYGLRSEALRQLAEQGVKVVITVDCGITACEEALEARRLGLKLIVTDHHEFAARLPDAEALVHPRLPGTDYPFGGLSGSGVAFKLAWALCQKISGGQKVEARFREFLLDGVALASLGLIADVVPLHDENRIFVKHGLSRIRSAPTIGIKALVESAGLTPEQPLRAEDVAFKLAPRLNAAGRLGCARLVVELLTTANPQRAKDLAAYLDGQNKERQNLERMIVHQAKEMVAEQKAAKFPALVLADPDWHPGVIGIVAGRLAEAFGRPTLLIASGSDPAPGSGRSIPGFALHEALTACSADLCSHGGHAAAAGFRVALDRIDAFRAAFSAYTAAQFPGGLPPPQLTLDAEVPLSALTFGLLKEIDRLEPYGAQNSRPKFLAGGLQIVGEPKKIGGGERHLGFRVKQGGNTIRAVAFGMADRLDDLMSAGGACSLVFTPRLNEWNGYSSVEIEVVDFQAGAVAKLG